MDKKKKGKVHWTAAATECYLRGGKCEGCYYREILHINDCQMKKTLLLLIQRGKKPKNLKREDILE